MTKTRGRATNLKLPTGNASVKSDPMSTSNVRSRRLFLFEIEFAVVAIISLIWINISSRRRGPVAAILRTIQFVKTGTSHSATVTPDSYTR